MKGHNMRAILIVLAGGLMAGCASQPEPQAVADYTNDFPAVTGVVRRAVVAGLPNAELAKGLVNLGSLLLSDLPALV